MPTFLFNETIFGPVQSRRLGSSLGINLLPTHAKFCNFNCLYCECGLTDKAYGSKSKELPTRKLVKEDLEISLQDFLKKEQRIDALTFAGNGEPTLHPDFPGIIDDTISLRNQLFPKAKIAVLSNATLISRSGIKEALLKVDSNILKLDSGIENTIRIINCPMGDFSIENLIKDLSTFTKNLTIQTLFVKGSFQGREFDNSSEKEIKSWLEIIHILKPEMVMVYTIARDTPIDTIQKISPDILHNIANRVEKSGYPVSIST